jgi:signal transduction histidine kinase
VLLSVTPDARVIDADHALIKRVFSNLIQNALTHSARAVTVTLGARAENAGTLFTVADDGVGIPPEYHDIIFRKFEQVKTPHIPRVRSSGLGLAFCKLVVEAHGGRIWVKSGPERQGSAFHFWLPDHPPASSAPIAGSLAS